MKRLVVLGGGESGVGAALLGKEKERTIRHGYGADFVQS